MSALQVIADELLAAAAQLEASYADPYDEPVYGIQLAKVEAKAAREAARAAAAAAKAARWVMAFTMSGRRSVVKLCSMCWSDLLHVAQQAACRRPC